MIKNKVNNKCYIGQTIALDINTRWKSHKSNINTNRCPVLYSAFRKYGIDNFEFKIICICFDEACDDLEISYISKFNSIAPNGYNLESGGNKNKIIHHETCEKISKALTGKKHSEERKQKNSNAQKGKKWSDEQKQNMSKQRKGLKQNLSDEERYKRSERLKNNPIYNYGKESVAEANRTRVWTDEMKQKISKSCAKLYSKMCKKVGKYTLDNVFIESFSSITEASAQCAVRMGGISKCCNCTRNTYKGYIWKFI